MGPGKGTVNRTTVPAGTAEHAARTELVRPSCILPCFGSKMAKVGAWLASDHLGSVGYSSNVSGTRLALMPWYRRYACHIAPILAALFIGFIGAALLDRAEPTPVLQAYIEPQVIHPGGVGTIHYTIREDRVCDGIVHRWLVDSRGVIFDLVDIPTEHAKPDADSNITSFAREVPIPWGISSGPAGYYADTYHWCNPLQKYLWPIHKTTAAAVIKFAITRDDLERGLQGIPGIPGIQGEQGIPGPRGPSGK